MKIPKIAWIIGRAFGLGGAALAVAASGTKDVEACHLCEQQSNGNYGCPYYMGMSYDGCYIYGTPPDQHCQPMGWCSGG